MTFFDIVPDGVVVCQNPKVLDVLKDGGDTNRINLIIARHKFSLSLLEEFGEC